MSLLLTVELLTYHSEQIYLISHGFWLSDSCRVLNKSAVCRSFPERIAHAMHDIFQNCHWTHVVLMWMCLYFIFSPSLTSDFYLPLLCWVLNMSSFWTWVEPAPEDRALAGLQRTQNCPGGDICKFSCGSIITTVNFLYSFYILELQHLYVSLLAFFSWHNIYNIYHAVTKTTRKSIVAKSANLLSFFIYSHVCMCFNSNI